MSIENKKQLLDNWLEAHPGKTPENWLLEKRCVSESQREAMCRLLDFCRENNIEFAIAATMPLRTSYRDIAPQLFKEFYPIRIRREDFRDDIDYELARLVWGNKVNVHYASNVQFDVRFSIPHSAGLQYFFDMDMPEGLFDSGIDVASRLIGIFRWKFRDTPMREHFASVLFDSCKDPYVYHGYPLLHWDTEEFRHLLASRL